MSLTMEADGESALPEPVHGAQRDLRDAPRLSIGRSAIPAQPDPLPPQGHHRILHGCADSQPRHALIEQGRIEEIIQAKPAESRALVEEAAGLSLFKGRREMSERKLERVKENLARLDDVLAEIERQLNFARRQAKKAEAFRLVRQELDELERLSAARRLLDQRGEFDRYSARESGARGQIEAIRDRACELESETKSLGNGLSAVRRGGAAVLRELENLRAGVAERARTREFLERRGPAIDALTPTSIARAREMEERAIAARAARAGTGARLAREKREDDGGERALAVLRRDHEVANSSLNNREAAAEELKDELSDWCARRAGHPRPISRLERRVGRPRPTRAQRRDRAACARRSKRAYRRGVANCGGGNLKRRAPKSTGSTAPGARPPIARTRPAPVSNGSRRESPPGGIPIPLPIAIGSPSENGAGRKLRTVLESLNGDLRPSTDPSFLFDVIKAPAELRSALSAVLGDQAEAVIVDSPDFALRAIEVLKQKQGGRLSFIPAPELMPARHAISAPGVACRLVEMVSVAPGFEPVVEAALGHVMVAEDLPSALAASNLNGHGALFVTREGDVLWPGRMIAGGSVREADAENGNGASPGEHPDDELEQIAAEEQALAVQLDSRRASREQLALDLKPRCGSPPMPRTRLARSGRRSRRSSRSFPSRGRIAMTHRGGRAKFARLWRPQTRGSPISPPPNNRRASGSPRSATKSRS